MALNAPCEYAARNSAMGIAQALTAQGVKPSGVFGWVTAWTMPLLFRSLYAKVARVLDLQPEDEVLDVACGSGVFLRRYGAGARRIAGIDHSGIQVRIARQQHRKRIAAGTAEIVRGDSAALPWGDATFSAVTCNCIGCFAQPLQSAREMHRVLRPGGRLVLAVDFYPDEESARRAEQKWGLPTWTEAEARTMLADAGFTDVSVSHDGAVTLARATKER
jgi:SAM-dependent methyltransferase